MKSIVFFDDKCALCRRTINFLHRHDKPHRLSFASLESKTAHKYLKGKYAYFRTLNTIVFLELPSKHFSIRGRAVISILGKLGGWWSLVGWMRWLPFIDLIYRVIAHHRKRGGKLPKLQVTLFH
jgi:predicted DCC family thiol-disulfide oxidoreductase YuxK